jgi:amino acid adenylation domain-containing protein
MRSDTLENEISPLKALALPRQNRQESSRKVSATLQQSLDDCWARFGENCALEVDGARFTYADLGWKAKAGATAITGAGCQGPFVVVFGYRSAAAFLGILSTLKAGKAYLPVSHKFPPERLLEIFQISTADTLFLCAELAAHFREFLASHDDQLPTLNVLYWPQEAQAISSLMSEFPRHKYFPISEKSDGRAADFPQAAGDDYAYMLFTSGSTGKPKGIAITQNNVCAYLRVMLGHYDFHPDDRFSQCFDLTFDYSVHDMFCCFLSGACLCAVPADSLLAPAKFIEERQITVWFSVPSLAMTMEKLRMLRPARFPSIRLSFFGGEAVSENTMRTWQAAAPNSIVHNVYGPTEATINITHYRWDPKVSPRQCVDGGVPLGHSLPGLEIRIVDSAGRELPHGQKGELVVRGPQIAPGYYKNPEKTAQAFHAVGDDPDSVWYCTGDLASRDELGLIRYFGRLDFQVQICGHRVELTEIEAVLRKAAGTDFAIAVPWPYAPQSGRADSVIAVIAAEALSETSQAEIQRQCRASLPAYAVPARIVCMPEFPFNANGKTDRKAIAHILKETLT